VHTENIEIVWRLRDELMQSGRDDLKAWNDSRPPSTEAEAIYRAAYFANEFSCPLYIVHVSSDAAMREIELDRQRFRDLTLYAETCPHYLTHSYESPIGSVGKVNPPLRAPSDAEALWHALARGAIDTLGSDHVGRRLEKKQGSIWKASAGFPGLPTTFLTLLSEGHHKRGIPLERIADVCARTPARIFGLGDRKGDLKLGFDADLVLVDLDAEWKVTAAQLGTWSDYSLYDGWTFKGKPRMTFVRGRKIVEDFNMVDTSPRGRYTRPSPAAARSEVA
jgi:dihydroorotase-like cyclic amidohydrolase